MRDRREIKPLPYWKVVIGCVVLGCLVAAFVWCSGST
jgi:hypothetical protein